MTIKTITAQNINAKTITAFLGQEKNLRDKLQMIIVACIGHAKEHNNDFTLLSKLVAGLKERKGRNLQAVTAYILDHVKGIHWTYLGKSKDKTNMGYKTIPNTKVDYLEINKPWFEHKKNVQRVAEMDVLARAKSLLTTLTKEISEGHIKKGQEQQAGELREMLSTFLPAKG